MKLIMQPVPIFRRVSPLLQNRDLAASYRAAAFWAFSALFEASNACR